MKIEQVAVQLFTLRQHLKTPEDIATTLEKVAAIGYRAVQVSGMGPIPEADLVSLCKANGLTICSTHEPGGEIVDNTAAVIERLQKLGCDHTAYPHPHVALTSAQAALDLARQLDAAGKLMRENGITLSYHNHAVEFRKFDGKTVLEIIYEHTAPEHLEAELDCYWVQAGGGSPLGWCKKMANRQRAVHLKDAVVPVDQNQLHFCEVGSGNIDWPEILPVLDGGNCEWFIVEQDQTPGDPFESLSMSFGYLKTLAT